MRLGCKTASTPLELDLVNVVITIKTLEYNVKLTTSLVLPNVQVEASNWWTGLAPQRAGWRCAWEGAGAAVLVYDGIFGRGGNVLTIDAAVICYSIRDEASHVQCLSSLTRGCDEAIGSSVPQLLQGNVRTVMSDWLIIRIKHIQHQDLQSLKDLYKSAMVGDSFLKPDGHSEKPVWSCFQVLLLLTEITTFLASHCTGYESSLFSCAQSVCHLKNYNYAGVECSPGKILLNIVCHRAQIVNTGANVTESGFLPNVETKQN
ncbi:hypothetical protein EMCRGX_G030100 [Ephydatia muelleri]